MQRRVLIIDDEKPVRIAIGKLGQWAKYGLEPPVYAENGKEALEAMRQIHPVLIFVDMQMPVMSGTEFLKQAADLPGKHAFIVVSGFDEFGYAQQAIHYGASDYLLKPVVAEELNTAMERAMSRLFPGEITSGESNQNLSAAAVVELLRDTILRDYTQNIRLQDFADQYYFSREYLSRLFKATYGTGIAEYLTGVRMDHAAQLLKNPDIKITDIAARVGYSDNNYFSKVFHTAYGVSPSEYRLKEIR